MKRNSRWHSEETAIQVQYQVADSSCTVSEWSSAFCGKVIKTTAMLQKKLEAMVSKYGMESMPKLPKADCHLISWKRKRNKCSGTQGKRTKKRKSWDRSLLWSAITIHISTPNNSSPTSNHKQPQATTSNFALIHSRNLSRLNDDWMSDMQLTLGEKSLDQVQL